jgi:hypothetical protein
MTTDYDEGYVVLDHEEFLEQAWEVYRATNSEAPSISTGSLQVSLLS